MGGGGGGDVDPKESAQERELAAISKEQMDRWWNQGRPAQMQWIEDGLVDENDRSLMGDAVGAKVHQQAQQQRTALGQQQRSRGISPTSGNATMGRAALEDEATGRIGGRAQATGQHSMTNKNLGHLMNATSVLRGEGVDAQQGLSGLADAATRDSIHDANMNLYDNQTEGQEVGAVAGAGLRGLESWYGNRNTG
jgi:hypothetical protein